MINTCPCITSKQHSDGRIYKNTTTAYACQQCIEDYIWKQRA